VSFTIQRILGIAPVIIGLFLLTPTPGLAQFAKPDLVVNLLNPAPPATGKPGDSFVIAARVLNQGAGTAGASITRFELVNTVGGAVKNLKGVQNVSTLAPGASAQPTVTIAIYSDTVPGTYRVRACANSKEPKVPETDTTNNCLLSSGTLIVQDVPDLVVTAISEPPPTVPLGQRFPSPTTYTVQNTGGVSAAGFLVKFYLIPAVGTGQVDLKTAVPEAVGTLGPAATFTHAVTLTVRVPETVPGTYFLLACADSGKTVSESDENDNCKRSVGTVQVTPAPDLLVKRVTVVDAPLAGDSVTVNQGDPIAIHATVRNEGLLDAPASTLKLTLVSTGAVPAQTKLGEMAVPGLLAGKQAQLDATPSVDELTPPGTYTLQGCADYNKKVPESFEKNNCATALGTVTVTGLPPSLADLAVTALTPPPATRLPGESFPLTATVQNHGTETSPSTTNKFYLVNAVVNPTVRKNLKGVQLLNPVAAGATNATPVTVEVYADTVPGNYFLQACADGEKQIREQDEDDNCRTSSSPITVSEAPDLVVSQVGNPPASTLPGKSFSMTYTVNNVGPIAATLPSRVKFSLVSTADATIVFPMSGSQDVPPLGVGPSAIFNGTGSVTVRPETLPGSYRVQGCADSGKVVFENDEDDNCALSTGVVQVTAVPDLVVTLVSPPLVPVAHNTQVALTTRVKNKGLADAGGSYLRFFLVSTPGAAPAKKIPEAVQVAALAHGVEAPTTGTVTIPNSTLPGHYYLQACIAIVNVVEASSENNCATSVTTFQVQ
jgi:subtilase family serine protease